MDGHRGRLARLVAAVVVGILLVGITPSVDVQTVVAKESKAPAACPKKLGPLKLDRATPYPERNKQLCYYLRTGKKRGAGSLEIEWWPDVQGERARCSSRTPQFRSVRDGYVLWRLESGTKSVAAHAGWHGASVAQASKAIHQAVSAAEPLAHPCIPDVEPNASDGVVCPLVLPGGLVRGDWYQDPGHAPVIEDWLGFDDEYVLRCRYVPAYSEEPEAGTIHVAWAEDEPYNTKLCFPTDERDNGVRRRTGHYPVEIDIQDDFVNNWPSQAAALADSLAAAATARAQRCPDAPDGPPPYEQASATAASQGSGGTITILLSGGPDEEPPGVGTTIELPADDQHEVVVGGADGEVIREGYLGNQATISGYNATVTDADGNWVVLVTVDVSTAPEPTAAPTDEATSTPSPAPVADVPTAAPTVQAPTPAPTTAATAVETVAPATPVPPAEPAATPAPGAATPAADDSSEVLAALPAGVAAVAKDLPPEGVDALLNILLDIGALGEMIDESGRGEVTILASDIAALQALAPDVIADVRPSSGSVIVSPASKKVGEILVTPIIGQSGLIEVRLNRFTIATSHSLVRGLVAALNSYVAERGGRYELISVTPDGITVTAAGPRR